MQRIQKRIPCGAWDPEQRGKSHHTALRSLGFKWIRIMYRCWRNKTHYDETQYIQALQRTHSPVLAFMAQQKIIVDNSVDNVLVAC
jgi:hypothetical protein